MKVGVLGSGDVAKALAAGFLKHGHQITVGTNHPERSSPYKRLFGSLQVDIDRTRVPHDDEITFQ